MDDADEEREQQQPHRFIDRREPQGWYHDIGVEECFCDNGDRVTEEAAEQNAPEYRGNTAIEEHCQRLAQTFFHVFELV